MRHRTEADIERENRHTHTYRKTEGDNTYHGPLRADPLLPVFEQPNLGPPEAIPPLPVVVEDPEHTDRAHRDAHPFPCALVAPARADAHACFRRDALCVRV